MLKAARITRLAYMNPVIKGPWVLMVAPSLFVDAFKINLSRFPSYGKFVIFRVNANQENSSRKRDQKQWLG